MKLVTFEVRTALGSQSRVGCLSEDGAAVWDINACTAYQLEAGGWSHPWERADLDAPPSMIEFLATGPAGIAGAQATVRAAAESGIHDHRRRAPAVRDDRREEPRAPVPRPPSVRDFLMVREHVENAFARLPPDKRPPHSIEDMAHTPGHWKGDPDNVFGPDDTVPYPSFTNELDYELELAVVIGRPGHDVSAEDAHLHIAGYTIFNDWSARDLQMEEMKIGLGPGLSKFRVLDRPVHQDHRGLRPHDRYHDCPGQRAGVVAGYNGGCCGRSPAGLLGLSRPGTAAGRRDRPGERSPRRVRPGTGEVPTAGKPPSSCMWTA